MHEHDEKEPGQDEKEPREGALNLDAVSAFLARVARITGMAFREVKGPGDQTHMQFSVPVSPATLPALLAAIPAAIAEEAIEKAMTLQKTPPPPNNHFDGKKRF